MREILKPRPLCRIHARSLRISGSQIFTKASESTTLLASTLVREGVLRSSPQSVLELALSPWPRPFRVIDQRNSSLWVITLIHAQPRPVFDAH